MIKLLKSGDWALQGVEIVAMQAGEVVNFGPVENSKLVDAGWADWHKAEKKAEAEEAPRRPGRPPKDR